MMGLFFLTILGVFFTLIFRAHNTSENVPIIYNVIYGEVKTGPLYTLYLYLLSLTVFGGLNLSIAWSLFNKERLLSYLLGVSNILLGVLMILYVFNLTALVR